MEVYSSSYYDWLGRPPSYGELANIELDNKIKDIYEDNDGRCDYILIFKALQKQCYTHSFNLVIRIYSVYV